MNSFFNFSEITNQASELYKLAKDMPGKDMDIQDLDKPILVDVSDDIKKETYDGVTFYYDDFGSIYRADNELLPEGDYEINGYKYEIDGHGRIISVEGFLHLKDREGRLTIVDSIDTIGRGDQELNDDRGHLIGDQFDGSNGLENMIPQDARINRVDFKNYENELASAVKDGRAVYVRIEPQYRGDSYRPDAVVMESAIDGRLAMRIFPNHSEVN